MTDAQPRPRNKRWNKKEVEQKQVEKTQEIKDRLVENEKLAKNAPPPPPAPKKEKLIDSGKRIISKFFKGYSSVDRANVTADFDSNVAGRMAAPYYDAIEESVYVDDVSDFDSTVEVMVEQFAGAIDLGIAAKASASAPDDEKRALGNLFCLKDTKVPLPQKVQTAVDCIGKTDLGNENRFRINQQNLVAKRHLLRSLLGLLPEKTLSSYLVDEDFFTLDTLRGSVYDDSLFDFAVDNSTRSLARIRKIGLDHMNAWKNKDINVSIVRDSVEKNYAFRLPNIELNEDSEETEVFGYFENDIFETFGITMEMIKPFVCGCICAVASPKWIRHSKKKMSELSQGIQDSIFGDMTFNEIMTECKMWNINDFFTDSSLNELGNEAIHRWNNVLVKKFEKFLTFSEMSYSPFGSSAQLVQVEPNKPGEKPPIKHEKFDKFFSRYKGKRRSTTPLVIPEFEASLGISLGFTKNIKIEPTHSIEFDSMNENIFLQFIKSDFK